MDIEKFLRRTIPAEFHFLFDNVAISEPDKRQAALFAGGVNALVILGKFDSAIALLSHHIEKATAANYRLMLLLARLHLRSGQVGRAKKLFLKLVKAPDVSLEAAFDLLEQWPELSTGVDLESMMLAAPIWRQEIHGRYAQDWIARGRADRAASFLSQWLQRHPIDPKSVANVAEIALYLGDVATSRKLLRMHHPYLNQHAASLMGRFDESIPPYTQAFADQVHKKIEAAFSNANFPNAAASPESAGLPRNVRVLLAGISPEPFPNDLAHHIHNAAQAVPGLELKSVLSNLLMLPHRAFVVDGMIDQEIGKFRKVIDDFRPDLILLEIVGTTWRGLSPTILHELKKTYGFKLICMFRDSHLECKYLVDMWADLADTLLVFDHASYAVTSGRDELTRKAFVFPVPMVYGSPPPIAQRDISTLFLGATNFKLRLYVLSEILGEACDLEALFGPARRAMAPDMDSYLSLLSRSKAVINFSRHALDVHLVTGRVWEAISRGACLIEQRNPVTEQFLVPYRHYLPWENAADIVHYSYFVKEFPETIQMIASEAFSYCSGRFGPEKFWADLIDQTLNRPEYPSTAYRDTEQRSRTLSVDTWSFGDLFLLAAEDLAGYDWRLASPGTRVPLAVGGNEP